MRRLLLLDTNILIDVERRHRPTISFVSSIRGEDLAISMMTYGEMLQGALWVAHSPSAILQLERTIEGIELLAVTKAVMQRYGFLRGSLRQVGISIAAADALIAATAIEERRTLVTRNTRHFSGIPGLELIDPLDPSS